MTGNTVFGVRLAWNTQRTDLLQEQPMPGAAHVRLLDVCDEKVIRFRLGRYELRHDLAWLDQLRPLGAVEAVILHSSRILEVMTRKLVVTMDNLALAIDSLGDYHHLPGRLKKCLHQLRRLGNDARHVIRPLNAEEADLAYLVILHWLAWFFCERDPADRVQSLLVYNQPLDGLLPERLGRLVRRLDTDKMDDPGFIASLRLDADNSELLLSPVMPALLVESLLEREHHEPARAVLSAARRRFESDLRLRQLEGLYYSRTGELEKALRTLEEAPRTGTVADEETEGILAGAYKRCWQRTPGDQEMLLRCHCTYRDAWERSGQSNTYLGINAATTALWLGIANVARDLAGVVANRLEARRRQLGQQVGHGELNYWDRVTLAESYLLLKREKEACEGYEAAFRRYPEQVENIRVSREQARQIVERLGLGPAGHGYLEGE
jgi:tetratricopeptide (TPR) repeat protein